MVRRIDADGFDQHGCCDDCQRTRAQGHLSGCASGPSEYTLQRMEVTKQGIQCPWCPHGPAIHLCPHDPIRLMKRIEVLEAENRSLLIKTQDYDRLRNAIKNLIA